MNIDKIKGELSKHSQIYENESLAIRTGFRTGGNAAVLVLPRSRDELIECMRLLGGVKYFILGNGTNVLVPDEGYDGVVVLTRPALCDIHLISDDEVYCEAGVSLSTLAEFCRDKSLSGVECLYGIPGSVGGAVYMNAGAYGGEIKDVVLQVEYFKDGEITNYSSSECDFGYRHSIFSSLDGVILSCIVKLQKKPKSEIEESMKELLMRRVEKQPLNYPSCGSTFKRPTGAYASKLIDDCGWRGKMHGGAQVSEKHCGFIINRSSATSSDILELIEAIKHDVKNKTGHELECEIELMK